MILVDSSVWIAHLRKSEPTLVVALVEGVICQHPFVTAELALGSLAERDHFVSMLDCLPQAKSIKHDELLDFITDKRLFGTGIGMVDAQLLASATALRSGQLWTYDKRLHAQAVRLNLAYQP